MYRRYIIVGAVFFILIGAYFIFFDKDKENDDYEKYYNKLVVNDTFVNYLDDVNLNIQEIGGENDKYTYTITFDGVSEDKNNIKILALADNCSKDKLEKFPSFGIISNKGYSLVKEGNEDEENKRLKGINLVIIDKEKINGFIIYFACDDNEQFVKAQVNDFSN